MPKKAFLKLAPEKQEELVQKGMRLYVECPYEDITLQVLLDILSLHPTTFYRYFDDKDELYFYMCTLSLGKMEVYCRAKNENFDWDIFTYYEGSGPLSELEVAFGKTLLKLPREVLLRGYMDVFKDGLFNTYKAALRRLRDEGKLRADVDDNLVSFMYATTMFNMILYFREFGIEDTEAQSEMKKYFYMNFFRHGLLHSDKDEG